MVSAPKIYPTNLKGRRSAADAFVTRSGGGYKVHSPARVDGNTTIFGFANFTPDVAIVMMPDAVVGLNHGLTEIPAHHIAEFSLVSGAAGDHEYSVVMKTDAGRLVTAHGSSDPVIIIDPPCP